VDSIETIWQAQCDATKVIRQRYGVKRALEYLVGEKLIQYAELTERDARLSAPLAAFVAEVRQLFSHEELQEYVEALEQQKIFAAEPPPMIHGMIQASVRPSESASVGSRRWCSAAPHEIACANSKPAAKGNPLT
jgi:hypothetical protein